MCELHIPVVQMEVSVIASPYSFDTSESPSAREYQAYIVVFSVQKQDRRLWYCQYCCTKHTRRIRANIRCTSLLLRGDFVETADVLLPASALVTPLGLLPPLVGPRTVFCLGGIMLLSIRCLVSSRYRRCIETVVVSRFFHARRVAFVLSPPNSPKVSCWRVVSRGVNLLDVWNVFWEIN